MAEYIRINWQDEKTKVNAKNLNHMEEGIENAYTLAELANTNMDTALQRISTVQSQVEQNSTDIDTIETTLEGVENVSEQVDKNTTAISKNSTDIASTKSTLTTVSTSVESNTSDISDIKTRLAQLEYTDVVISSFSASPATLEMGDTSGNVILAITANKLLNPTTDSVTVDGTSVVVKADSKIASLVVTKPTTTKTYSAKIVDTVGELTSTATKSATVSVYYALFSGVAASVDAFKTSTSKNKQLKSSSACTITETATTGQHIYFATPYNDNPTFWSGGIEGGFKKVSGEQKITNSFGKETTYYIYESTNTNLGKTTIEIKRG